VSNEDDEQLLIGSVEGMPARMGVFTVNSLSHACILFVYTLVYD
jgi:hypothetical protein